MPTGLRRPEGMPPGRFLDEKDSAEISYAYEYTGAWNGIFCWRRFSRDTTHPLSQASRRNDFRLHHERPGWVYLWEYHQECEQGTLPREFINWPVCMGYVALPASILGSLVAAWFWTRRMKRYMRNLFPRRDIVFLGIGWGLIAGWGAACILWAFECLYFAGIAGLRPGILGTAIFGIFFFGSIGGLGAGFVCGVVWAVYMGLFKEKNGIPF